MLRRFCIAMCAIHIAVSKEAASKEEAQPQPHIILIVADDLGWNDVSWHNRKVLTPHLESLAKDGVFLEQSYVQPICTPTRSALLTGKYPYTIGRQQGVLWPQEPTGLSIKRQILPEALKSAGYDTHAVGKWHLGFCSWDYTPTSRGFDTFWGYYTGAEDYYHHTRGSLTDEVDLECNDVLESLYKDSFDTGRNFGYDFRNNTKTDYSVDGEYSTYAFSSYVEDLLESRSFRDPMFLYLPFQSVHSPLQVPENYTKHFQHIKDHSRRIKLGMILAMDEAVGRIVEKLKSTGHYDNSVIIFTTDNGGPTISAGNNWPLRGNKTTLWEGGTRGVAFVHSPLLTNKRVVSHKLIHVTDWFPTLVSLGGGVAPRDSDGFDQWEAISVGARSPRSIMIYNIDIKDHQLNAGIRMGDYKLLVGHPGPGEWTPPPEGDSVVPQDFQFSTEATEHPLNHNEFNVTSDSLPNSPEAKNSSTASIKRNSIDFTMIDAYSKEIGKMSQEDNIDEHEEFVDPIQNNEHLEMNVAESDHEHLEVNVAESDHEHIEVNVAESDHEHLEVNSAESNHEHLEVKAAESGLTSNELFSDNQTVPNSNIETGYSTASPYSEFRDKTNTPEKDFDTWNDMIALGDLGIDPIYFNGISHLLDSATPIRLYNLLLDPEERNNLAAGKKDVVKILLKLIEHNMDDYVKPDVLPNVPEGNPRYYNGTWSPGWCKAK